MAFFEVLEAFIHDSFSVVYDDDSFAQVFDVVDVVAGQKNRCFFLFVDSFYFFAQLFFGYDVHADCGFVQKKDFWGVEQACDEFAAHALSQGEFSHGLV